MHGVAVVGSRQGGIPELIEDGLNGLLCEPGSPADLARAMQTLIDDRSLPARLAARAPAVKSIQDDARAWESRYERLLTGEPVPATR